MQTVAYRVTCVNPRTLHPKGNIKTVMAQLFICTSLPKYKAFEISFLLMGGGTSRFEKIKVLYISLINIFIHCYSFIPVYKICLQENRTQFYLIYHNYLLYTYVYIFKFVILSKCFFVVDSISILYLVQKVRFHFHPVIIIVRFYCYEFSPLCLFSYLGI